MKKLEEVKTKPGEKYGSLSLAKLLSDGVKVVDVTGRISMEFGEPVFRLRSIVFSDETSAWCEGEHDLPYITETEHLSSEQMQSLSDEADAEET